MFNCKDGGMLAKHLESQDLLICRTGDIYFYERGGGIKKQGTLCYIKQVDESWVW